MKHYTNWIVLGPKRSGSKAVAESIKQLLRSVTKIKTNLIGPNCPPRTLSYGEIVHTHDINWLKYKAENTGVVLCVRDPVECAYSWCILTLMGQYHFHHNVAADIIKVNVLANSIKPTYININDFKTEYEYAASFYDNVEIDNSYRIIDYSDWSNDPTKILRHLGYDMDCNKILLPMKNPGTHKDWISNYDEIDSVAKTLSKKRLKSTSIFVNDKY